MLSIARTRISVALVLGLVALLIAGFIVPAHAAGKSDGKSGGKSANASAAAAAPQWTEDNDTNDGNTPNNVVDNNDNRHPSGKDRSVEHGRSGNQGKAKSDPDDDSRGPERTNGGADKPNGPGGVDQADQDGNNGCGNDDDFEDDNEGRCGRRPSGGNTPAQPDKPGKPSNPGNGNPGNGNPGNGNPGNGNPGNGGGNPGNGGGNPGSGGGNPGNGGGNPGNGGSAVVGASYDCSGTVQVTSTKDLSNVVLRYQDGDVKFDGLNGYSRNFAVATGRTLTAVFVKSGSNHSGEGPGYGQRINVGACGSTTPTNPTGPNTGTDPDDGDVDGVVIVRPPANDPAPVVIIRTPRRDPAPSTTPVRNPADPSDSNITRRVLAATGGTSTTLAMLAALSLVLGAGLLGFRRFARSSR